MGLGLSVRRTRLAKAYLSIGRRDDALTCARSAVELSTKHHERANQALALEALADITACDDTAGPGDAVDLYARSLALANELGMRPLVAHCRAGLGTLHRRIGSRGESDDHLAAAAVMYREMGMTYWLEQAEAETGAKRERVMRPIILALIAALLFGLSTPAAKILLDTTDPWLLAGLFYLGSGLGLGGLRVILLLIGRAPRDAPLRRRDVPWLTGAILTGGIVGPVFLMFGLAGGSASQAALLLNLEGVLTAALAWLVFQEHVDARIALGMALITGGALVLAWQPDRGEPIGRHAVFVAGACLAWALDNNLTRKVSGGDATLVAALKGGAAGAVNLTIAMAMGAPFPGWGDAFGAAAVGLLGYGVSLMLFVLALRELGAARTGAYFSTAPFIGAVASIAMLGEPVSRRLAAGGLLMAAGVWLHVSERHVHEHVHEPLAHEHIHRHDDAHHAHEHEAGTSEPHSHWHVHGELRHSHPHYPDLHHRHRHT